MIRETTIILTLLCSCVRVSTASAAAKEEWDHHIILDGDGKYHLSWTFANDEIKFKAEVQTKGYVGFGLSFNGAMAGSDIVTGWVKNGKAYFQDRHGIGNQLPVVDVRQDWTLIEGMENDTHTVLRFRRILETCDKDDIKIDNSTIRLIYAYSDEDPIENDSSAIQYHGTKRGVKSAVLLQPKVQATKLDLSIPYWEILSPNFTLNGENSMYWCTIHKTPDIKEKNHVVLIKPLIMEGNEQFVHHMLLYECFGDQEVYANYENEASQGYQCRHPNMPDEMWKCEGVYFAWAVGGNDLILPEHVGLPLEPSKYYMLEVHYDNPQGVEGITDQSGLRLYYTPKLREQDAGTLMVGSTVSPRMFIPPGIEKYVISGHSNPKCLKPAMSENGVKVLGVLLHSHLIGRSIKARHFRRNDSISVELPPLAEDKHYDFNYQEYRILPKEVELLPDDQITIECTYNSLERKSVTFGGEDTADEMCLAFLLHYPRIGRFASLSVPTLQVINEELGTKLDFTDIRNRRWLDSLQHYDWKNINATRLEAAMRFWAHDTHCYMGDGSKNLVKAKISYPYNLLQSYKNLKVCHDTKAGTANARGDEEGTKIVRNSGHQIHDWMMKYLSFLTCILNILFLKAVSLPQ